MQLEFIDDVLRRVNDGELCDVHGRVTAIRNHGKLLFLDIADRTGKLQLVIDKSETIPQITEGSYIAAQGNLQSNRRGQRELTSSDVRVLAHSSLHLDPKPWEIDGTDPVHGNQVFGYPGFYVANQQRAAIFALKAAFINGLHDYYQQHRFTLVEPPILTNKTLYGPDNAIATHVHGEQLFLSQCATFELEPLALALGKVYTISPAFRNERSGSKRHLAEYTHAKAELLLATIDDLMTIASDSIFTAVASMVDTCSTELNCLQTNINLELLHPSQHEHITYTEAIRIAQQHGSHVSWGEGLSHSDEKLLTAHMGNKYVWVQFPPRTTEGFPYKPKPDELELSMVSDLIAPHGSGEMVGVAEKSTSAEELIEGILAKGLGSQIHQYWEYIALRHFGLPPHGGIGAAPERIIYGLLNLDHIRLTKPWPRYPDRKIRVPQGHLPTFNDPALEQLIATYQLPHDPSL
jgi:asparaginyl-tRNA synthetase